MIRPVSAGIASRRGRSRFTVRDGDLAPKAVAAARVKSGPSAELLIAVLGGPGDSADLLGTSAMRKFLKASIVIGGLGTAIAAVKAEQDKPPVLSCYQIAAPAVPTTCK